MQTQPVKHIRWTCDVKHLKQFSGQYRKEWKLKQKYLLKTLLLVASRCISTLVNPLKRSGWSLQYLFFCAIRTKDFHQAYHRLFYWFLQGSKCHSAWGHCWFIHAGRPRCCWLQLCLLIFIELQMAVFKQKLSLFLHSYIISSAGEVQMVMVF